MTCLTISDKLVPANALLQKIVTCQACNRQNVRVSSRIVTAPLYPIRNRFSALDVKIIFSHVNTLISRFSDRSMHELLFQEIRSLAIPPTSRTEICHEKARRQTPTYVFLLYVFDTVERQYRGVKDIGCCK